MNKTEPQAAPCLFALDRYDPAWAMRPIWEGDTVYNESLLMVESAAGEIRAPLLYYPGDIISVRDVTLQKTYAEGVDWEIRDGWLCRLPGSSLPYLPYQEFFCPGEEGEFVMHLESGGRMIVNFPSYFYRGLVSVTYTHPYPWRWEKPAFKGNLLPQTLQKLRDRQPVTVVFYGDSVTCGDDVSGKSGTAPHTPTWAEMAAEQLRTAYGGPVELINNALGGTGSDWGIANAAERVAAPRPDLAVIGFGANDRIPPEEYRRNIETILEIVRRDSPHTEFILVDPMTPNRWVAKQDGYRWYVLQDRFAEQHRLMEGTGVAVLETMKIHHHLREVKRFWDLSANNINHPNDFLYRVMAQCCAALLIPAFGSLLEGNP